MRSALLTLLVEPNALFREGLNRIFRNARFGMLRSTPALDDSTEISTSPQHKHTLLVVGPGNDADAAARQIGLFREKEAKGRVAVVANHYRQRDVLSAIRAGANAYFVEITDTQAFVKSLELVALGETLLPAEILPLLFERGAAQASHEALHDSIAPAKPAWKLSDSDVMMAGQAAPVLTTTESSDAPNLSPRERGILGYLVEGHANKVIASKICISEATVKVHIKAILRKIRVHNRTQAAIWAVNSDPLFYASPSDNGRLNGEPRPN
jgi:two-component system, NarL family, nitrate/nitrite response regulator NarL